VRLAARIDDHEDGEVLMIEVEDAATGRRLPPVESGSGIALDTLRRRLSRRYGDGASLALTPTAQGMRAVVRLPLEEGGLLTDRRAA
jgi:LytS/YehU family sensor histidine kinase